MYLTHKLFHFVSEICTASSSFVGFCDFLQNHFGFARLKWILLWWRRPTSNDNENPCNGLKLNSKWMSNNINGMDALKLSESIAVHTLHTFSMHRQHQEVCIWLRKNENQTFAKLVRHLFGRNTHGEWERERVSESVSNKLKLGFETSINENEILVSEHAHTQTQRRAEREREKEVHRHIYPNGNSLSNFGNSSLPN